MGFLFLPSSVTVTKLVSVEQLVPSASPLHKIATPLLDKDSSYFHAFLTLIFAQNHASSIHTEPECPSNFCDNA